MTEPDFYMPEYWPANRILGQIMDAQLEGLSAEKIVGQIVSDQIAALAAAKISGELTSEQIKNLAAGKITGTLTDAQIAEIGAAKIVGELTDSQLGGISAAKIIGELASGQIASLAAAKISGQLTDAQIKSITAAQVTGQLTDAQLEGLATAKLEGLMTSEQIENLAVAKLIGEISNSQIAAKAVTAGKIDVATLSAISVDAGTIEAGLFKGVTFETADGDLKIDDTGISIQAGANNVNTIRWREKEKSSAFIMTRIVEMAGPFFQAFLDLVAGSTSYGGGRLELTAKSEKNSNGNSLSIGSFPAPSPGNAITTHLRQDGSFHTITQEGGKSSFWQIFGNPAKRGIDRGTATIVFPGGSPASNIITINHGLGATPVYVGAMLSASEVTTIPFVFRYIAGSLNENSFKLRCYADTNVSAVSVEFRWIAMT